MRRIGMWLVLFGAVSAMAAERSFCDLGEALNAGDSTNGGFWSIAGRANAVVCDSSSSVVSVATAPGSRLVSDGISLCSIPGGMTIILR